MSGRQWPRVLAIVGLLLACPYTFAATTRCEASAALAQETIPAERLANWEPVDDRTLLVWTLHDSRAHLVQLDRPLQGLLDAPTVYLITQDRDPTVCACGHDEVMVPGGGSARIISIRYLSAKRTAELDPKGTSASRIRTTFT
jgi:uncharacterized protein DUF6491